MGKLSEIAKGTRNKKPNEVRKATFPFSKLILRSKCQ